MNVTSRIEDIAQRGEILIAESTRLALGAAYSLGEPRTLQAPGIDELITVHPLEHELP
jgi:class 3 adenylate cyclase